MDPLAFSWFWAFLENFEGGGELEPPLFPLLIRLHLFGVHNQFVYIKYIEHIYDETLQIVSRMIEIAN